ncbi:hypothetical protein CC1G_14975 [Coprinopsis cinerea okayama7|uniref:Uncharacterized protein n=1 Tax=Coprinopsis cinerea (strain Okayama-7 / 130 / ATCC MYA-4618 / FGSC 9003) TaxID=240176 RepID=D6RPA7_COPC7|nr:hypothetical protein CC1G_14975 [Coprinopsis cinerea okayama7\|eukprot:XP_002910644.1 hypothetical protein CC1G_14975 [Coprinopsis cinerea okayama7\
MEATDAATHSRNRIHFEPSTRIVVGAVIGSIVGVIFLLALFLLWRHYWRARNAERTEEVVVEEGKQPPHGIESEFLDSMSDPDPFAAGEVRTIVSSAHNTSPTLTPSSSPQKSEFERDSKFGNDDHVTHFHDVSMTEMRQSRASGDLTGIPELSRTFVAHVRATARSPPPAV